MTNSITIPKHPKLTETEDFAALRKQGIDLIQQLGSAFWTDYNIHDPGITLLELLCYGQTELGYQLGFSVEDLLAPMPGNKTDLAPYFDKQTFYTARNILTVNPWTVNDFRKLLIDQDGIRNAWLECKRCSCDFTIYANCRKSSLQYEKTEHPVRIKGFYDVLLELETDPVNGDLNSGKVFNRLTFLSNGRFTNATVELRFPAWHRADSQINTFSSLIKEKSFLAPGGIQVVSISGNPLQLTDIPPAELYRALRNPLFVTLDLGFHAIAGAPLQVARLENIPLKVWYRNDDDRKAITLDQLKTMLADTSAAGVANRYLSQLKAASTVIKQATQRLHNHRNLTEDFCRISTVPVEDVAVCADIEMAADADIEGVLGQAYWLIDQYLSPVVPFYSLQQLLDAKTPTEAIFNGPALNHGFILDADLDKSGLKTKVFTSDLINILMDIPGITAVKNISLGRYNALGKLVESQAWELAITPGYQARFYTQASKVLAFKNGLPFLPDADELNDTLLLWKGRNSQQKLVQPINDLPVPTGQYVDLRTYYPLQYSLPETYGVGPHGLPNPVTEERKAQARQLKAYLLIFEQLLATYMQQLAHFRDLLSTDPAVQHTYFSYVFTIDTLLGVGDLYPEGLSETALSTEFQRLLEDEAGFAKRRNQFLDHLLSRFAESFSDYALMLYSASASRVRTDMELIDDKINFLKALPEVSAKRGRAFNYKDETAVCSDTNRTGLQERIRVLLGLDASEPVFVVEHILLRPRNRPSASIKDGDPMLSICIPPNCHLCGEEDPYSFRITVVLSGEEGIANGGIAFRRFAEKTIRQEVPAHIGVKICWVSGVQLTTFGTLWCDWLGELSRSEPRPTVLNQKLKPLLDEFAILKSVYPKATLHDCVDGDDENRVYLNQTVI